MAEKNFYRCQQCSRIYFREEDQNNFCETCGQVDLELMEGRFILRCKKCGLTQNQKAYLILSGIDSLHCQSSTCNGQIKAIMLGQKSSTSSSSSSSSSSHSPVPGRQKHPSIPTRRGLAPRQDLDRIRSQRLIPSPNTPNQPNQPDHSQMPSNTNSFPISQFSSPFPTSPSPEIQMKNHSGIREGDYLDLNGQFYQITKKLGTGGMGAVWQGKNVLTNQLVAIKEFYYTRFHDPESGQNNCEKYWNREKRLVQLQSDSEERTMHFVGELKLEQFNIPEYYIFIEYIKGISLDNWYEQKFQNDVKNVSINDLRRMIKEILMPICRHMYHVHQKGIVHRDLTVQNVMIFEEDDHLTPIIIDWGVAKEIGINQMYNPRKPYYISSAPEATGIRNRGTPPEVMAGFQPIAVTDIYMLGHIMFYLFSGGHYCGTAATNEDFVLHPGDFNPNLPDEFGRMVEYMTQYEPADRMPNMIKVYEAFQWLYKNSETLENPSQSYPKYYLHCEYNDGLIELPEQQRIRLGRELVIQSGRNHDYDGHLYNALLPTDQGQFAFEVFIDSGYAFIRDPFQEIYISNLTSINQQVYNDIPIRGLDNCAIVLSDANLNITTIEVPFIAPDGITYRIPFKIVLR